MRHVLTPSPRALLRRLAVLVAAAAMVLAGLGAPAAAQPPKPFAPATFAPSAPVPAGFASWAELVGVQARLNAAADRIVAAGSPGYAGVIAAPETRELWVYFKGAAPADLAARAAGVPVRVLPARYSEREMQAAARQLAKRAGVTAVSPRPDGAGLYVGVAGAVSAKTRAGLEQASALPVTVQPGTRPSALFNRQNDTPWYWGGGRYYSPVGGCSTGFAVNHAGNSRMISAGHCGSNGDAVYDGGNTASDFMGGLYGDDDSRDILLIDTRSSGRVFIGPWTSSASVGVAGVGGNYVGNYMCTLGASSGENCGIRIEATGQYVNVGYVIGPMVRAARPSGCAAAPGDSGGPAAVPAADGRAVALGTISAGQLGTATCAGANANGSRVVWYADLSQSLAYYGASVITG